MKTPRNLFPAVLASIILLPLAAQANLIVNGNFSSGNTGFSSDYSYVANNTAAGEYYVQSSAANTWNAGFLPVVGQGGSGNYLIANGATNTTQSAWFQTINNPSVTLTTDTNAPIYYRFQAYVNNLVNTNFAPPDLSFEISVNGGAYNAFTATPTITPGTWTLVYADTYITTQPTSLGFRLRNQATNYNGNDFAVDSIYFGLTTNSGTYPTYGLRSAGDITNPTFVAPTNAVPEPGTWAAAALLAGGAAFVRWRKRAKVS
ncbi:MAG: PEP-CTERM sorting domain-containing protein [Chthoniobacterales bacterium]|nr:PEP-CTERM sorting domain-containing protein [Chthoniobacterales bacterium]